MNKIIKKYYILIIFLFFLAVSSIYFWPFLRNPAFNLIDDGMSLQVSKKIISGDFSNFIEINSGRVRPLYWIYFSLIYIVSGINPLGFWIGQTIVVSATLFSLWYLLTSNVSIKSWKIHLIVLVLPIIFFIPAVSENLYRLGTAEVRQLLFIILFLIWMKKSVERNIPNWPGFLLFLLALLTKETSIFLAPLLIIFYLPYIVKEYLTKSKIKKHKEKICFLIFFGFFTLIYYSFLSTIKDSSSYASGFGLDLSQLKLNFLISRLEMNEIYYLLLILLTLGITRLFLFLKEKKLYI